MNIKSSAYAALLLLGSCQDAATSPAPPVLTAKNSGSADVSKPAHAAKTCLNLVNGQTTTDFPAVYALAAVSTVGGISATVCTGTFVSDNLLVTASHCLPAVGHDSDLVLVGNGSEGLPDFANLAKYPRAIATFAGNPDMRNSLQVVAGTTFQHNDFGLALFPANTAKTSAVLPRSKAAFGKQVQLVGYGQTSGGAPDPTMHPTKRTGSNLIFDVTKTQMAASYDPYLYLLRGRLTSSGASKTGPVDTMTGHGDSGGPLLDGNTLLGVLSGGVDGNSISNLAGIIGADYIVNYHDLTSPQFQTLLKTAMAAGAHANYAGATGNPAAASAQSTAIGGDSGTLDEVTPVGEGLSPCAAAVPTK